MYQTIYSYESFVEFMRNNNLKNEDLPWTGVNDKGENVVYSTVKNFDTGEISYQTETSQNNGWIRINVYYKDGSSEEFYMK